MLNYLQLSLTTNSTMSPGSYQRQWCLRSSFLGILPIHSDPAHPQKPKSKQFLGVLKPVVHRSHSKEACLECATSSLNYGVGEEED